MFLCLPSFADEVKIPFAVHKADFVKDIGRQGLDLTGQMGSSGFVENKGMMIEVFSYRSLTGDELTLITQAALRNQR